MKATEQIKVHRGVAKSGGYIISLLQFVGVPKAMLYVKRNPFVRSHTFWQRNINFLAILETAKNCFHAKIKKHFVNGICSEMGRKLIYAIRTIEKRFAERGMVLE